MEPVSARPEDRGDIICTLLAQASSLVGDAETHVIAAAYVAPRSVRVRYMSSCHQVLLLACLIVGLQLIRCIHSALAYGTLVRDAQISAIVFNHRWIEPLIQDSIDNTVFREAVQRLLLKERPFDAVNLLHYDLLCPFEQTLVKLQLNRYITMCKQIPRRATRPDRHIRRSVSSLLTATQWLRGMSIVEQMMAFEQEGFTLERSLNRHAYNHATMETAS